MLRYHKFVVNVVQENAYLLWDETNLACLIDPGFSNISEQQSLIDFLEKHELQLAKCLCTHLHFDHVWGAKFISEHYGIDVEASKEEIEVMPDLDSQLKSFGLPADVGTNSFKPLSPPKVISFGNTELEVISTPGHSPGHICLYNHQSKALFCGDVLFKSGYGRYDLWGGDYESLMASIQGLFTLPDDTIVLSGHGDITTIGAEKSHFNQ